MKLVTIAAAAVLSVASAAHALPINYWHVKPIRVETVEMPQPPLQSEHVSTQLLARGLTNEVTKLPDMNMVSKIADIVDGGRTSPVKPDGPLATSIHANIRQRPQSAFGAYVRPPASDLRGGNEHPKHFDFDLNEPAPLEDEVLIHPTFANSDRRLADTRSEANDITRHPSPLFGKGAPRVTSDEGSAGPPLRSASLSRPVGTHKPVDLSQLSVPISTTRASAQKPNLIDTAAPADHSISSSLETPVAQPVEAQLASWQSKKRRTARANDQPRKFSKLSTLTASTGRKPPTPRLNLKSSREVIVPDHLKPYSAHAPPLRTGDGKFAATWAAGKLPTNLNERALQIMAHDKAKTRAARQGKSWLTVWKLSKEDRWTDQQVARAIQEYKSGTRLLSAQRREQREMIQEE